MEKNELDRSINCPNIIQFGQNKLTETWKIADKFFRFSDWTRGYNDVSAGGKKSLEKKLSLLKVV